MTLSLLHVNPATGTTATITATASVAVGGYVNRNWRGVGACATQGLATNPWYPETVRRHLEAGHDARQALAATVSRDPRACDRQCLVMDAQGRAAVHNGQANHPVVAQALYPGVAAAGNMLAHAGVVEAFARRFLENACENGAAVLDHAAMPTYYPDHEARLVEMLIDALEAALLAGGDYRGARSAALRIESWHRAPIDLRVDWSEGSLVADLRALAARVASDDFQRFLDILPTR